MKSDIYIFNSTCEMAVANGVFSYMPPKRFRKMEQDLACIPSFFAKQNDIVIVPYDIPSDWVEKMNSLGLKMPRFLKYEDIPKEEISFLRPWGWSPAAHFYFKNLYENTSSEFKETVNSKWSDSFKDLYSRLTARNVLESIIKDSNSSLYPNIDELPVKCTSLEEVQSCVDSMDRVLLKAPWSSSGRGLYLLDPNVITEVNKQWISGVLKNQKYVMAEVWKEKVCDLSFQYSVDSNGDISFLGTTSFETDSKGNYKGNYINTESVLENNSKLSDFLHDDFLEEVNNNIIIALRKSLIPNKYSFVFGVDCMVYFENGIYKIQPCVEINLRYNMGYLSMKVKERIHPEAKGIVRTDYVSDVDSFLKEHEERFPIVMSDSLLKEGFIPLSYTKSSQAFITYLIL